MRDLLKAICLVLALAVSAGAGQTASPQSFRDAALAADAKYDTTAALAALDQGLKLFPNDPGLLAAKGRVYWRIMRTATAEQALITASKSRAFAAEAKYFLGRIYDFKGSHAEGAYPGFHEEVSYRPRAAAAFAAAGTPQPEWTATLDGADAALKAADAEITRLQSSNLPEPQLQPALRAAIEKRLAMRPDPAAYIANANLVLARKSDLMFVSVLATNGIHEGDRFIDENASSYKLDGKVRAFTDRNEAALIDAEGWAFYLTGQFPAAERRLAEAARLYRNADPLNELHLAELSRTQNSLENAREHYLTALGLAGITAAQRQQATSALADIQVKNGENPAAFDKWLTETLEQKRDQRRQELVGSMAGQKLPDLVLKDLQGNKIDLRAERGHVVLLNFFSAWCGACKVELPLIQKAYEKYDGAAGVKFILVSLDDDPARLDRYVAERKFAMPVARYTREQAAKVFNVHDTPTTLYVDKSGTIQYQVVGIEPHGDAIERVTWYIEQLKSRQ